jgi:hypothetical protein
MIDDAAAAASAIFGGVADGAVKSADAIATSAYATLSQSTGGMVDSVVKTATSTTEMAAKLGQDKLAELEQWKDEIRDEVTILVEKKVLQKLHDIFGTVGESIKESLYDEDMPEVSEHAPRWTRPQLTAPPRLNPNPNCAAPHCS